MQFWHAATDTHPRHVRAGHLVATHSQRLGREPCCSNAWRPRPPPRIAPPRIASLRMATTTMVQPRIATAGMATTRMARHGAAQNSDDQTSTA
eukprot:scaffold17394_cov114-Isochrysis_galbana.AAC.6